MRHNKSLWNSGGLMLCIVIALVMAGIAIMPKSHSWFSSNSGTSGTGMQVGVSLDSFEIAVSDSQVSVWAPNSPVMTYLSDESNGGYTTSTVTDSSNTAIMFNITTDSPTEDPTVISPGAFGTVSFDVIPKTDGRLVVDIAFDYLALQSDEHGNLSALTTNGQTIHNLMLGHILLFTTRAQIAGTGSYRYSGCLNYSGAGEGIAGHLTFDSDNTTTFPVRTVNGEDRYTVTVYWVWPATFAQLALSQNDPNLLHSFALFGNETDRQEMLEHISDYIDFFSYSENLPDPLPSGYESSLYVSMCGGYNNGDQLIGDSATHFILKAHFTKVDSEEQNGHEPLS